MSVERKELLACLEELLSPEAFNDFCPNGLQVEGRSRVQVLVCGVTANQALIDRAIEIGADAILVHHGFFWKGESAAVVGMKYRRLKALMDHGINLIGYHLPLDAHPQYGNNSELARLLGITVTGGMESGNPRSIGSVGRLAEPMTVAAFGERVADVLNREPLIVAGGDHKIETIAWCSGAAQSYLKQAAALNVDAYLSGEISEPVVHDARELGVHYIAAGHHATERYGVQAVGRYLAQKFDIDYQFVDIDSPA
jgi:dinuclear metal center YbgI/SA1388 family protein